MAIGVAGNIVAFTAVLVAAGVIGSYSSVLLRACGLGLPLVVFLTLLDERLRKSRRYCMSAVLLLEATIAYVGLTTADDWPESILPSTLYVAPLALVMSYAAILSNETGKPPENPPQVLDQEC
ncbi:MAG TPA: hypothetical protein VFM55_08305 [Micromonosporaceae bacterium]|nr:hypothetical protein [Micromonosporaceae bacterium]